VMSMAWLRASRATLRFIFRIPAPVIRNYLNADLSRQDAAPTIQNGTYV
jgi:hypothetical protein